ncbi:uncharacterized protein LOC118430561 [Branchiostoma floridae]|uniref:Uncharacterized protein LOC118430561 n=1 Tax=Branchiostoma floridae TaxID=7739 RepID=A0A9J7MAN4_BRAFL|nr:uncharacterized protein LOC118430561 [Branchiostoma floridae]
MTSNRNCGKCGKKCDNCSTPGAVPSTSSLGKAKYKGKHPVKYKDWGSRDPRDSSGSDEEEFQRIFKDNKKKTEYKRKQYFDTPGTKKKKTKNLDDVIVTMSILRRNVTTNNLTTVYDSGIGVKVPVFASASIIQEETERKLRALRKIVSSDGKHVLTNKDGVWLKFIPGTKEQFTVQKYKELRGLPGWKIHLYLLPVRDYLAVQKNAKERRDPHWKEARDFLDHPFEDTCKKEPTSATSSEDDVQIVGDTKGESLVLEEDSPEDSLVVQLGQTTSPCFGQNEDTLPVQTVQFGPKTSTPQGAKAMTPPSVKLQVWYLAPNL